jgi:hypothetical protein
MDLGGRDLGVYAVHLTIMAWRVVSVVSLLPVLQTRSVSESAAGSSANNASDV